MSLIEDTNYNDIDLPSDSPNKQNVKNHTNANMLATSSNTI